MNSQRSKHARSEPAQPQPAIPSQPEPFASPGETTSASPVSRVSSKPRTRFARTYTPTSQIQNMHQGYLFAEAQGLRPNAFLTINLVSWRGDDGWKSGASTREHEAKLRDRLRDALVNFYDRNRIPQAWVYMLENDYAGGVGLHGHYLIYLPLDRYDELRRALGECLRKKLGWTKDEITELLTEKMTLPEWREDVGRLPFYFQDGANSPALSAQEAEVKLVYMGKSVDPREMITYKGRKISIADHAGIDGNGNAYPKDAQTPITLQRQSTNRPSKCAGTSRSLDAAARRAAGWVEVKEDLGWLSRKVIFERKAKNVMAMLRRVMSVPVTTVATDSDHAS